MQSFSTFIPPERTLMGPGPSDVNPRILNAMARPTLGHLDPLFIELMDQTKQLLQYAFKTENALTMPISAPGSAGMEACFVNLVEPGDKVLVCINGVFGNRMVENVERCGGEAITVNNTWGEQTDLNVVEDTLKANPDIKILAFVHAETSTGVRNEAKALCELAKKYDCLSIVDAVTSLGGIELDVDGWSIDAIYSGSQKCLSCVPGISPVSFSERAVNVIQNRETKVQSWFLDMNLIVGYWGQGAKRAYHHTAPVNSMYAMYEALLILKEEGLENAWQRHALGHEKLAQGLSELGLELTVDSAYRLPQLNVVKIPDGVDDAAVRKQLLEDFNLEIGAGLGDHAGKVWRIGLMGYACKPRNIDHCLAALRTVLK
ncbi:MAG: alanine--glyoxylate aminotransferase family protein [Alteromonas macleodii]|jgi:alanine-glyoxylate transaminase/serine-glyoxylate transaminase/serine-pyruvate transaminase|uniref:pyridoxal-phosphate-dependent aminotransferase family protein n=1 Tax=Alteromonas TaxID=226 RepID=UPI00059E8FA2|nr:MULTISPECIES: alanine--glyoxylate aminotransferase family protein [Alteromonas]MDM7963196.1 alanine--glyoxylate aminotransferase family protein [Alteromonas macleodii]MDM8171638.1 alanine--glyoxylate aminotransferase family protein [Alteromonas macleodii]CAI3957134.1 alanine-glyoxylate aminotransferase [Alteromonas macleodii]VTP55306.1 alanine-glyoxylate aminotransferase [Alteromonas macleodii]|tara:strand:- start:1577 stop:2698 length:1122 start_codon:yes stop_codon:yes gene_type:complete